MNSLSLIYYFFKKSVSKKGTYPLARFPCTSARECWAYIYAALIIVFYIKVYTLAAAVEVKFKLYKEGE